MAGGRIHLDLFITKETIYYSSPAINGTDVDQRQKHHRDLGISTGTLWKARFQNNCRRVKMIKKEQNEDSQMLRDITDQDNCWPGSPVFEKRGQWIQVGIFVSQRSRNKTNSEKKATKKHKNKPTQDRNAYSAFQNSLFICVWLRLWLHWSNDHEGRTWTVTSIVSSGSSGMPRITVLLFSTGLCTKLTRRYLIGETCWYYSTPWYAGYFPPATSHSHKSKLKCSLVPERDRTKNLPSSAESQLPRSLAQPPFRNRTEERV